MKFTLFAALFAAVAFAAPPKAATPAPGSAVGTFTINGQTSQIKYAYLSHEPYEKKEAMVVTLSDVPLSGDQIGDTAMNLTDLTRTGKAHVIILKIDPEKEVYSCDLYNKAIADTGRMGVGGLNEIALTDFTPAHVAGRGYMKEPYKAMSDTIFYDVTFNATTKK